MNFFIVCGHAAVCFKCGKTRLSRQVDVSSENYLNQLIPYKSDVDIKFAVIVAIAIG